MKTMLWLLGTFAIGVGFGAAQEVGEPCAECGKNPDDPIHQPPRADHPFRACACDIAITRLSAGEAADSGEIAIQGRFEIESPHPSNIYGEEHSIRTHWQFRLAGEDKLRKKTIDHPLETFSIEAGGPFCPATSSGFRRIYHASDVIAYARSQIALEFQVGQSDVLDLSVKISGGQLSPRTLTSAVFLQCPGRSARSQRVLLLSGAETAQWPK